MSTERRNNSVRKLKNAGKSTILNFHKLRDVDQKENLDKEEGCVRVDKTPWESRSIERNWEIIECLTTRPFI
jgi:hypothetical protein